METFFEIVTGCGWRRGELISLTVGQVDLPGRVIKLEPGKTKNGDGRTVPIYSPRLEELLRKCVAGKKDEDAVFTWGRGRSKGKPVRDFRVAWEKLFAAAGVAPRTPHDMRRTAARDGSLENQRFLNRQQQDRARAQQAQADRNRQQDADRKARHRAMAEAWAPRPSYPSSGDAPPYAASHVDRARHESRAPLAALTKRTKGRYG